MLRFPVKKIRKQFKLLLLLVLLTSAVWFTYLHINQGKTIKLHFNYGKGNRDEPFLVPFNEIRVCVLKPAVRFFVRCSELHMKVQRR